MATLTEDIDTNGYSSTARKVLVLGANGTGYATGINPLPVFSSVGSSILQSAKEVGNSAVAIPATALTNRKAIMLYNNGSETVYLGSSTVSAVNGYPMAPGAEKAFDITDDVVLYGITESGTSDVRVIEGA